MNSVLRIQPTNLTNVAYPARGEKPLFISPEISILLAFLRIALLVNRYAANVLFKSQSGLEYSKTGDRGAQSCAVVAVLSLVSFFVAYRPDSGVACFSPRAVTDGSGDILFTTTVGGLCSPEFSPACEYRIGR